MAKRLNCKQLNGYSPEVFSVFILVAPLNLAVVAAVNLQFANSTALLEVGDNI